MSTTEFGWPGWAGGAGGGWQGASFSSISLTPIGQVTWDVLKFLTAGGMVAGLHWRFHSYYPDAILRVLDFAYEELDPNYSFQNFVVEDNMWVGPGVRFYVV